MKPLYVFSALLLSLPALAASPTERGFLDTGDAHARHWLSYAVAQGCIQLDLSSWPVSRRAVQRALSDFSDQSVGCDTSLQRRLSRLLRGHATEAFLTVGLATQEPVWRHFDDYVTDEVAMAAGMRFRQGRFSGQLQAAWIDGDRDDRQERFDHSYLAAHWGNWALGVGAVDRWWGPGWYSSLALSNNARPVTGLWLSREEQQAFDSPWLSWIGPWNLVLFGGQLEQDRYVPDAKLLGARLTVQPLAGLQLGATRLIQWGGEGRPEHTRSLWHALIGKDNGATSGHAEGEDPGNQIAGIDARYEWAPVAVYLQMMGEDEAGYLPSKWSLLAGMDWSPAPNQRWILEYTDTQAGAIGGQGGPHIMYEHSIYRTGFRYHGRNLASTWEGDAQVVTLGVQHYFEQDFQLFAQLNRAELNRVDGQQRARLHPDGSAILQSQGAASLWIAEASISHPLAGGRLHWHLGATDKAFSSFAGDHDRWYASLSWTFAMGL